MILQQTIDQIKQTADIVEVIGDFITLKRQGANFVGLCPFHDDRSPSLLVSPRLGIFKCFVCESKGDAISFLQKHEGMSYPEALLYLAEKYNIEVKQTELSRDQQEKLSEKEFMRVLNKFAADYFRVNVKVENARNYLRNRGLKDATLKEFGIGYAPDDWQGFEKIALSSGYNKDQLLAASLLTKSEKGNTYDFFKNRIIFPYQDLSGHVIGFSGRDISGGEVAKYKNSAETVLFNKSKILYGIYQARQNIIKQNECLVVEGHIDVLSLSQAGLKNVVAGSGTSFSREQVMLLKRFTENVLLIYDGDPAGTKAALRNIDIFVEAGMKVRAISLPDGMDPDDFCKNKTAGQVKDYFKKNRKDILHFIYQALGGDGVIDLIERTEMIKSIVSTVLKVTDATLRNAYISELKTGFKIPAESIDDILAKSRQESKHLDVVKNGWIGLEFARDAIRENDKVNITFDRKTLLSWQANDEENTICFEGKMDEIYLQEINVLTTNVFFIDSFSLFDKKNRPTDQVLFLKQLFHYKINITCLDINDEEISFYDQFVNLSAQFITDNPGNDMLVKRVIEDVAELLSHENESFRSMKISSTVTRLSLSKAAFDKILKPFVEKNRTRVGMSMNGIISEGEILTFDPDRLPDYVDMKFFNRYRFFAAQNAKGIKIGYVFQNNHGGLMPVGNFYIEPLFHIYSIDPEKNKRVMKINNGILNRSFFIEMKSDIMIDLTAFKKALFREGSNLFTNCTSGMWESILSSYGDSFPTAYELTEFGQQHEGFYAFSNAIFSHGQVKYTDEFGLVEHDKKLYYSPAFSKIYSGLRKSDDKYENDRYFVYNESQKTDFKTWAELMDQVYYINDNGKWALIFAIMASFRSVIYPIDRLFTAPFFTGPTSSGKSQVAISIRSLFMKRDAPLFNLNSGTDAAFFTSLERYRDVPVVFEEYNDHTISDAKFQGLKAAVYDGEGKQKRKDISSKDIDISKVNAVPVILGQESPERDDGSLFNRCVICVVPKNEAWTEDQTHRFQQLKEREISGLTNILVEILRFRPVVEKHYKELQRQTYKDLRNSLIESGNNVENRLINTISLFVTMVRLIENHIPDLKLPFTYDEFFAISREKIIAQSETIQSANRLALFFESLETLMLREKILTGRDFKIEPVSKITLQVNKTKSEEKVFPDFKKVLFLRINNIHPHYMDLYRGEALKRQNLASYLEEHDAFIGQVKSTRFQWEEFAREETGGAVSFVKKKPSSNTSALCFDYDKLKEMVDIDLEKYKLDDYNPAINVNDEDPVILQSEMEF